MPQEVQIVPKYLHSHVETYINDYTEYEDEVAQVVDDNTKFACVFRSGEGIDNVFVKKMDTADFTKTYGESNYAKYGQPLMMPIALLKTGEASVYCMRVMPDDAFAANCILSVLYKTDNETGKMILKYRATYIDKDDFSSPSLYKKSTVFKQQLLNMAQALREDEPDEEGFKCMPLMTFRMVGRGVYGNDYRWRIARNMEYEMDYGIKMYSFEILRNTNGLETVAKYVGAMNASSKYKSLTLINDILENKSPGTFPMDVFVIEENYNELYEIYKEFVDSLDESLQDDMPDVDEWDPFFARGVANDTVCKNLQIMSETPLDEDIITPDRPQGISLMGGDEGAFGNPDEQAVYEAETAAYVSAFSGDLDKTILSSRRLPVDIILDANYPFEVKQVIADLINMRETSLFYMDTGIETRLSEIDNIIDEYSIFNTRNISKNFQHYTLKDPITRKKAEVTVTYSMASLIPTHYARYGSHVPFVKGYSQISNHVKNSLEPSIDDVDLDVKEKLYKNRFNYYETIDENVYQRAAQNTAQMANSDLLEENNMMTLFAIKRILERDCWDKLYDFTSSKARADFTDYEMAKFQSWQGRQLDTIDIRFDANEWEGERCIVHCYVAVQFRNLMKRTIIEIDVNKRNFTG